MGVCVRLSGWLTDVGLLSWVCVDARCLLPLQAATEVPCIDAENKEGAASVH